MEPSIGLPDTVETATGWLTEQELANVRERVPMVYVDAVPVRVDHLGRVTKIGLLLRAMPDGSISRAVVSGRVLWGETIREALWRHLTKDLGNDCDPHLPVSPQPFTVVEYFPDPKRTGYHDPRQHKVALGFIVPIEGQPEPQGDALDFGWVTPEEAVSADVVREMSLGHDRVVRMALGHAGVLP